MYTNNLNGSYEYEKERRKDEMRAAAESQILHGLNGKRKLALPSPFVVIGILVLFFAVMRAF